MNAAEVPPEACDSHAHVFGAAGRLSVAGKVSYDLPVAQVEDYLSILDRNRLSRGVIVQPGAYGTDNSALLHALQNGEGRLRGIAAIDEAAAKGNVLAALAGQGVKGLRFTEVRDPSGSGRYRGTVGVDTLDHLAEEMRACGMHAQLWSPLGETIARADQLRASGMPVVLDHIGMVEVAAGLQQASFKALLDLLDEGWLWIKLSLCRLAKSPDYAEVRQFHDALVERAPARMLWASDWPFVRMTPAPDPGALLARFMAWVPDRRVQDMILVDNPAQLYGFEETSA